MTPPDELARLAREALEAWRAPGGQQHPVTFGDWMRWLGPCPPEVTRYIEAAMNEIPSLLARLEATERERDEARDCGGTACGDCRVCLRTMLAAAGR